MIERVQKFTDSDYSGGSGGTTPTPTPTSTPSSSPPPSGGSTGNQGSGGGTPTFCALQAPGVPNLYQAMRLGSSITVYFAPANGKVSSYVISYGKNKTADQYAVVWPHTGISPGALKYTISFLDPTSTYFIKLRAKNSCQPGGWSSILKVNPIPGGGVILITPVPGNSPTPSLSQTGQTPTSPTTATDNNGVGASSGSASNNQGSANGQSGSGGSSDTNTTSQSDTEKGILSSLSSFSHTLIMGTQTWLPGPGSVPLAVTHGIALAVLVAFLLPKTIFDVAGAALSLQDAPLSLLRFLFSGLEFFGLRKRVKPWGTVFDSTNGQPIDPAIVTLVKDSDEAGEKHMRITDIAGRFGFLVKSGSYHMLVKKTDYLFPSKVLAGKTSYKAYKNLYFGNSLAFAENDLVAVDIPLDPLRKNWNQQVKDQYYKRPHWFLGERFIVSLMLLIIVANAVFFLLQSSLLNGLVLVFSILLLLCRKVFGQRKRWGIVCDKKTHKALAGLVVKSIKTVAGQEVALAETTTDEMGQYYLLLSEGRQYLQVEKTENDKPSLLKRTKPFMLKKETPFAPDIAV